MASEFTVLWWSLPIGIGLFVYVKYGKDRSVEYDDKITISSKRREEIYEQLVEQLVENE